MRIEDLRNDARVWLVWRYGTRNGKPTKLPYQPMNPTKGADVKNSEHLSGYAMARSCMERNRFDGVGLSLSASAYKTPEGLVLFGIDVDALDNKTKPNPLMDEIKELFRGTYGETTPSGKGAHIIGLAREDMLPQGAEREQYYSKNSSKELELYYGSETRYFTYTGERFSDTDELTDQTDALVDFMEKYMRRTPQASAPSAGAPSSCVYDRRERLEKALTSDANNGRFRKLYNGDITGFPSPSEARLSLLQDIIFWFATTDPAEIDEIFRGSALCNGKWDTRRKGSTLGEIEIQRAISTHKGGFYDPNYHKANGGNTPQEATNKHRGGAAEGSGAAPASRKPDLTIAALAEELKAMGAGIRYNEMSARNEIDGKSATGRQLNFDDLITLLRELLAPRYKGCSMDVLQADLMFIGRENKFHPVLEWMKTLSWDKVDRIPQLIQILGLEDDPLSIVLVKKWLLQCVAVLFNGSQSEAPFSAEHVLTLVGPQGLGKTSIIRHLAVKPEWFCEGGRVDDRDKDCQRRVVTRWISELGEIESTMKSDVAALRAFISSSEDNYRLPYGRSDIIAPRRTSLAGTANSDRYLVDETGNRRFWTIPVSKPITREELANLDVTQLWAEVYEAVAPMTQTQRGACFRLTAEENEQLNLRNGEATKRLKGEDEVRDILDLAEAKQLPMVKMTVSEFKQEWNEYLRNYSTQQIGVALKQCGIEAKRGHGGVRLVLLPTKYKNDFAQPGTSYNNVTPMTK